MCFCDEKEQQEITENPGHRSARSRQHSEGASCAERNNHAQVLRNCMLLALAKGMCHCVIQTCAIQKIWPTKQNPKG